MATPPQPIPVDSNFQCEAFTQAPPPPAPGEENVRDTYYGNRSFWQEDGHFFQDLIVSGRILGAPEGIGNTIFFEGDVFICGNLGVREDVSIGGSVFVGESVAIEDDLIAGIITAREKLDAGLNGSTFTAIESGLNDEGDPITIQRVGIRESNPSESATLDVTGTGIFKDDLSRQEEARIGIGTTQPEQRVDIAGSIKIDRNIYDSTNSPAKNGFFLARDRFGIRWKEELVPLDGVNAGAIMLWGGNPNFIPPNYRRTDGQGGRPNIPDLVDADGIGRPYILFDPTPPPLAPELDVNANDLTTNPQISVINSVIDPQLVTEWTNSGTVSDGIGNRGRRYIVNDGGSPGWVRTSGSDLSDVESFSLYYEVQFNETGNIPQSTFGPELLSDGSNIVPVSIEVGLDLVQLNVAVGVGTSVLIPAASWAATLPNCVLIRYDSETSNLDVRVDASDTNIFRSLPIDVGQLSVSSVDNIWNCDDGSYQWYRFSFFSRYLSDFDYGTQVRRRDINYETG